jgi:hypothetical protein
MESLRGGLNNWVNPADEFLPENHTPWSLEDTIIYS